MTSESTRSQKIWMSPYVGFWRFNLDASRNDVEEISGTSWVVRDSAGAFILASCERAEVKWPMEVLEALATNRGLIVYSDYFGHEDVLI